VLTLCIEEEFKEQLGSSKAQNYTTPSNTSKGSVPIGGGLGGTQQPRYQNPANGGHGHSNLSVGRPPKTKSSYPQLLNESLAIRDTISRPAFPHDNPSSHPIRQPRTAIPCHKCQVHHLDYTTECPHHMKSTHIRIVLDDVARSMPKNMTLYDQLRAILKAKQAVS